ncbi:MAG: hypothetical protein ISQ07_13370, partial [Pirellulales bacterium]|nr:hypothetical protein [Pirellulales bacterium]
MSNTASLTGKAARSRALGILTAVAAFIGCDGRPPLDTGNASDPAAARDTQEPQDSKTSPFAFDLATSPKPASEETGPTSTSCTPFDDVSDVSGLIHVYDNGESGKSLMAEATGGGCGWLDYDRDGRPDILIGQGGDPSVVNRANEPSDRLFRNRTDSG